MPLYFLVRTKRPHVALFPHNELQPLECTSAITAALRTEIKALLVSECNIIGVLSSGKVA